MLHTATQMILLTTETLLFKPKDTLKVLLIPLRNHLFTTASVLSQLTSVLKR